MEVVGSPVVPRPVAACQGVPHMQRGPQGVVAAAGHTCLRVAAPSQQPGVVEACLPVASQLVASQQVAFQQVVSQQVASQQVAYQQVAYQQVAFL